MTRLALWQRLSILFVALLGTCFAVAAWLQMRQTQRQGQQVEQLLLHRLAAHLAAEARALDPQVMDDARLATVAQRLAATNPGIDVYQLDADGRVLHRHPATAPLLRSAVALPPIREFLSDAPPPILGDDPLQTGERKVFSVAPFVRDGEPPGYLYAVLQGSVYDRTVQGTSTMAASAIALWSVGLVAPLGMLAGVAAFRWVTRPLGDLTRDVERLERESAGLGAATPAADRTMQVERDEIAVLRAAFSRLVDTNARQWARLNRQDMQRREIVVKLSHELQTPLASVMGYLETLLLKAPELTPPQQSACVRAALDRSRDLQHLTQQFLALAKLELGTVRPTIERFSAVDLVLDVLDKLSLSAQARHLRLVPQVAGGLPEVAADIAMVERVLTSLVDNAIRHSPAEARVQVSLSRVEGGVRVEVADEGPGLPPELRARLFQADADPGDWPPSGELGLLIVRQLLRLHGDDLRWLDRPGTTLAFHLPAAAP